MKKFLLGLVVVLVILAGIPFLLPSTFSVARSIEIAGDTAAIFEYVNTLEKWPAWTAWSVEKYPEMTHTFEGPKSGKDARMSWTDPKNGNGSLVITSSDPARGITYDLLFEGFGKCEGSIAFETLGYRVKVTMATKGDLGNNPIARCLGLLMDGLMGPDLEAGLGKLEELVEKKG